MPFLYKTLKGIKSSLGISKRARYPITISILNEIYTKLKPLHSFDVDSSMSWAAFMLAFFEFLRSSEFTCNGRFDLQSHLTRSDISFQPNIFHPKYFTITIKKTKTDPSRETAKLTIAKSNSIVCAVTALQDYLPFANGRNLTCKALTNNLQAILHVCGLNSPHYASHSLRIEADTSPLSPPLLCLIPFTVGASNTSF